MSLSIWYRSDANSVRQPVRAIGRIGFLSGFRSRRSMRVGVSASWKYGAGGSTSNGTLSNNKYARAHRVLLPAVISTWTFPRALQRHRDPVLTLGVARTQALVHLTHEQRIATKYPALSDGVRFTRAVRNTSPHSNDATLCLIFSEHKSVHATTLVRSRKNESES